MVPTVTLRYITTKKRDSNMGETYQTKYQFNIHPNANCTIINDAQFLGEVTFYAGQQKGLPPTQQKVKEAIERLDKEGVMTNSNQWWAIYRVLTDLHGFDKNMRAFCKVMENMDASTTIRCDYNKWRNVNWANLTSRVDTWQGKSELLSQAEQSQVKVAVRLMELLE